MTTSNNTSSITKTKLRAVVGDATTFQKLMKERTKERKEKDDHSVAELRIKMSAMEDALSAEIKRRLSMKKTIQTHCDEQMARLQKHFETSLKDKMTFATERMDALEHAVSDLDRRLTAASETIPSDINKKGKELTQLVEKMREELQLETSHRRRREELIETQILEFSKKMTSELDDHKMERETGIEELRRMILTNESGRKEADDKFERLIESELAALREEIEVEVRERKMEDDEIVEALNRYTENLQASLSMISSFED